MERYQNVFQNSNDIYDKLLYLPYKYTKYIDKFNKLKQSPRKMCWFAENESWIYPFSQSHIQPLQVTKFSDYPIVDTIRKKIQNITNNTFNCCLVNIYENGSEFSDWHDDNEPWLGKDPIIASMSFGETRMFLTKSKISDKINSIILNHNDLLIMNKTFQNTHMHMLPQDNSSNKRINLTFRYIHPSLAHLQYTGCLKQYWDSKS